MMFRSLAFCLLAASMCIADGSVFSQLPTDTSNTINKNSSAQVESIPNNTRAKIIRAITVDDASINKIQQIDGASRRKLTANFPSDSEPSPLLTDLVGYWKLDETSGNATDSVGTSTLTDVNTVTTAAGKQGTARQFTQASNEHLSVADNTALSMGDIDFTIACWVYADSFTGQTGIISKLDPGTTESEYIVTHQQGTRRFEFYVTSDDATFPSAVADNLGNTSTATWYFIIAWHDSVANTINIQVNDGTVDSTAHTTGVRDGTQEFSVGSWSAPSPGTANHYWDGRIDEVGVWKRVLTSDEKTSLYNSGNGVTHPDFAMKSFKKLMYWLAGYTAPKRNHRDMNHVYL